MAVTDPCRAPARRARDVVNPRGTLALAAALAAAAGLFWATRIAAPKGLFDLTTTDVWIYSYPMYEAFYASVRAGMPLFWNPYLLCGIPWIGTLQGGFFYPPHLLYLLLPTYAALAASAVLHLALAAVSTLAFARRAGLGSAAAALAALLFTMRGSLPQWLLWPNMAEAAAWLPLGMLAVRRLSESPSRRAVALLALAMAASALAGSPQVTMLLGYGWATLLLALLIGRRAGARDWAFAAGAFAVALALGAAIGAVQLLPAIELARGGTRALQALTPSEQYTAVGGQPSVPLLLLPGSRSSFGLVASALLPTALWARHRVLTAWALVVGGLALIFALGPQTPLFEAYASIPGLGWFRQPGRLLLLTDWCFAIGVAAGFDRLVDARSTRARAAAALAIVTLVGLVALSLLEQAPSFGLWPVVLPATCAGVGLALLLLVPAARRRGLAIAGILALVTMELFVARARFARFPYTPRAGSLLRRHEAFFEELRARAGSGRVWLYSGLPPLDFGPSLASVYGLRGFDAHEPATLRLHAEYFSYLTEGTTSRGRSPLLFMGRAAPLSAPIGRPPTASRRRLVDLAAVRYLVLRDEETRHAAVRQFVADAGFRVTPSSPEGLTVYENPAALPRAYLAHATRPAPPPDALLARLSDPSFDPLAESYVADDPGLEQGRPTAAAEMPVFVRDDPHVVEIDTRSATPALLVLADTYHSGWTATVDGTPARIVRANHLFRGVSVPAGRHRVRFTYRPWSLIAGGAVSAAGICMLLALAWGATPASDPL